MKTIASLPLVGNPVGAFLPKTLADFMHEREERLKGERAQIIKPQPEKPKPRDRVRSHPRTKPQPSERPARAPRKDAQERRDALCALVASMVETAPVRLDGQAWAGPLTQVQWATKAGLTLPTFRRLCDDPRIVAFVKGIGRRKATYLRLGDAPPQNRKKVKNTIAKLWREHIGPELAAKRDVYLDNGLCWGLAEDLPHGRQVKVFEHALKNWDTFMLVAKGQIRTALDLHARGIPPDPDDPDTEAARVIPPADLKDVFLHHVSLSFLRRYHFVATAVYRADMQARQRPEAETGG